MIEKWIKEVWGYIGSLDVMFVILVVFVVFVLGMSYMLDRVDDMEEEDDCCEDEYDAWWSDNH